MCLLKEFALYALLFSFASYFFVSFWQEGAFFSNANAKLFSSSVPLVGDDNLSLPCGRCIGCRLERSRQWALRCVHESKMHARNCFVTLTFSPESLAKECVNGSLDKRHVQLFLKRLRFSFSSSIIRFFACGEYGDALSRPHYHLCLFGFDFDDRVPFSKSGDYWCYLSASLSKLWTFGHSTVCDFSFDTAAYVARYCIKKVTGDGAAAHYGGRQPEFSMMSLRPGIGKPWLDKYGKSDVFSYDECIVNRSRCKPPRYYDKLRERVDPAGFLFAKEARFAKRKLRDSSSSRLSTRMRCQILKFRKLFRKLEM